MIKTLIYKIQIAYYRCKYPENIWYGGGLKRETALASVGKGWAKFINNLYDAKPKTTAVTQVKEKYGTLRFYLSSAPDWYYDLVEYYEQKSGETCEHCGKPGELRGGSWLLTLCDECDKIRNEK